MAKLPLKYQFLDFSDYGRSLGHWIASKLQYTKFTAIHVTSMFIISGLLAIAFILNENYITAAFFIILKSVLGNSLFKCIKVSDVLYGGFRLNSTSEQIILLFFLQ